MKIILSLSGGLDSTVLLWHLLDQGHQVRCLSVDYGQRHKRELLAADEIARIAGCELFRASLGGLSPILAGSSQTSNDIPVPEGHYAEESMKATVVPNRNMLFLALAGAWAISTKSDAIAYAAHAGDHAIYPDCRPEFISAMATTFCLADWHKVYIERPFITWTKADIARRGVLLGAPLAKTWTCYKGGNKHCGKCGTCVERIEAFELAGYLDQVEYV